MKPAPSDDIKKELQQLPPKKVLDLLLKLIRFKKENKELLTYLLFEAHDEGGYVDTIKLEIDDLISESEGLAYTSLKKVLRKIPRIINKQIRYIGSKQAAVELHLHFAGKLSNMAGMATGRGIPEKLFVQQLGKVEKLLPFLEEDLRHDYTQQLERLTAQTGKKTWWKK